MRCGSWLSGLLGCEPLLIRRVVRAQPEASPHGTSRVGPRLTPGRVQSATTRRPRQCRCHRVPTPLAAIAVACLSSSQTLGSSPFRHHSTLTSAALAAVSAMITAARCSRVPQCRVRSARPECDRPQPYQPSAVSVNATCRVSSVGRVSLSESSIRSQPVAAARSGPTEAMCPCHRIGIT